MKCVLYPLYTFFNLHTDELILNFELMWPSEFLIVKLILTTQSLKWLCYRDCLTKVTKYLTSRIFVVVVFGILGDRPDNSSSEIIDHAVQCRWIFNRSLSLCCLDYTVHCWWIHNFLSFSPERVTVKNNSTNYKLLYL